MKRFFSRLSAIILLAVLLAQGLPSTVQAAGATGGVYETTSKSARFNDTEDGLWFPGDSITRIYQVKTVHKKPLTLYFNVDITSSSDLEDVLMMDVKINGKSIYPNPVPITQFKQDHEYVIPVNETATEYAITVSLDTSVTSAYENLDLEADFIWRHLEEAAESVTVTEIPKTGDQFPLAVLIAIMVSALTGLICLFILWKNRKKEDDA